MSVRDVTRLEQEIARLPREDRYALVTRVMRRLAADDPTVRRGKLEKLSRQMREWTKREPDHNDAWWEDFERELRENRLTFREIDLGEDDE